MNHRAIFHVMKLCGFPADDIRLFQRLYKRTFLFMGNLFGESAACFLARGVPQGSHPSPLVYVLTFNPIHVIARICGKGCSMHGLTPNGSSGFADDTTFHTDGVNAVSSMQAIVSLAGAFLTWTGQTLRCARASSRACRSFSTPVPPCRNRPGTNSSALP